MKLLASAKSKITKDKYGENFPYLEITEVLLVHFDIVNNDYQHDSRVLYTFIHIKSFGQLLDKSPKIFIFLKTFDLEFSYIEVWFTDQNSKWLETEDKINITLIINESVNIKMMCCLVQPIDQIFLKGYRFLSFAKNMDKDIGKNLSGKYSQKLFDHTKQSTTDSLDTVSKRAIHKKKKKSRGNWWFDW